MNRFILAAAVALLLPYHAFAQTTAPTYQGQDGFTKEATGVFCLSGCAGSGGGGAGDASAANQTSQITQATLTNTRIGDTASPAAGTLLARIAGLLQAGGAVSVSSSALPTGASTSALQTTGNTSIGTLAATVNTTGATAPATGQAVHAVTPAGVTVKLLADSTGRLLPAQGVPTQVAPIAYTSGITLLSAANAARIGMSVQVETSPTAAVYLCSAGQSTTCSATVHDAMIPAGAGIGTEYFFPWASTSAYYVVSAAAVTIAPHSVVAQ